MFWLVALTQALLWLLVPTLFYSAPPGDVADVLAIGHEMSFGSAQGSPLAYWLADIALRATGGHMIGVYLLAQICIVATYWAVFQLGRSLIGERQAVLAIMLMVGISVFTVSSPDFGPDILMMPLWALALLFPVARGRRGPAALLDRARRCVCADAADIAAGAAAAAGAGRAVPCHQRAWPACHILNIPAAVAAGIVDRCPMALLVRPNEACRASAFTAYFPRLRNTAPINQNVHRHGCGCSALVVVAHAGAGILGRAGQST